MASTARENGGPWEKDSDNQCNTQLCTSYVLGILACVLIIGGICLAFYRWDYMWLVVSAIGAILALLGAALHFCGSSTNQNHQRPKMEEREKPKKHGQIPTDQSIPSAPTLRDACSTSQLSLNMTPFHFPGYDTVPGDSNRPTSITSVSNFNINGQNYVLLPVDVECSVADTRNIAARLSEVFSNSSLEFVSGTTEQSTTQKDYRNYQIEDNVHANEPKSQSNRHSYLQTINGTIALWPPEERNTKHLMNDMQSGTRTCSQLPDYANSENTRTVLISNEERLIESGETLGEPMIETINTQIANSETQVSEEQRVGRNPEQECLYDFPRQLIRPVEPEHVVITNFNARSAGEHVGITVVKEPLLSTSVLQKSNDLVHDRNAKSVNYNNPSESTLQSDDISSDKQSSSGIVTASSRNSVHLRKSQQETSYEEFRGQENSLGHVPEVHVMCSQELNEHLVQNLEVQFPRESHDVQTSDLLSSPSVETVLEAQSFPPPSYEEVARDKRITESAYCSAFGTL
ncbi:uncharacterized protein LOC143256482 [Tachypleus tridentatus]|uniref:uncharacterized protein LOC143256482 n=1 Tax=Tachypleus tridentatus TaxID=6853 RepID=UPI003FD22544